MTDVEDNEFDSETAGQTEQTLEETVFYRTWWIKLLVAPLLVAIIAGTVLYLILPKEKPSAPEGNKIEVGGDYVEGDKVEGDKVLGDKIEIHGDKSVTLPSIEVFPEELEFNRKRSKSQQRFWVKNNSDVTVLSIGIEAVIEDIDQRCEEIRIEESWEPDKTRKDLLEAVLNAECFEIHNACNKRGERIVGVRFPKLGPKEDKPFVATFLSNCEHAVPDTQNVKIPLGVMDVHEVPMPSFSFEKNRIHVNTVQGFLTPCPGQGVSEDEEYNRIRQMVLSRLKTDVDATRRPVVVVTPMKDKQTGTYLSLQEIEGTRSKYNLPFRYRIDNVGSKWAKMVVLGRFGGTSEIPLKPDISPQDIRQILSNIRPQTPQPVARTLQGGQFIWLRDTGALEFPRALSRDELNLIEQFGIVFVHEVSYASESELNGGYKTTLINRVGKNSYSLILIKDEPVIGGDNGKEEKTK